MTATAIPALAADLDAGLRRLKLAAMRRLAPELLVTAKTQRWKPEEFLRTLQAGHKVRYFTAADLVETLYRGLADNSVGRVIETILRAELVIVDEVGFAPLDDTGAQLLFRFAAAYERRSLGIGSHWPFDQWGRFLPEHTTAVSLLDRLLHHSIVVVTEGESFRIPPCQTGVTWDD
ncbi:ATP-binding protein [Actinomadura sp. HBU206391]|uniref:ATP-binding protein n=1 Tax=Actinomadura sp. HBU206391 TaxID=2731692 RepID=UPI00164F1DFD|nr:ATP-binding protein [Actinomadura sp. HBU206391]MBC6462665.1 ATP-binding protein [Actinomadura sp. HBU206391]